MSIPTKDPADVLDYGWDWTAWLAEGETIAAALVTVPSGISLDSQTFTDTTVSAWLSGGSAGQVYRLLCHITTNQSRTIERSLTVPVAER